MHIALACLLVLWYILIFERFIAVLLFHYFKFMLPIDAMPFGNRMFYVSHALCGPNM
jgi:hypothetical protein